MAEIKKTYEPDVDLTIFKVIGELTFDDLHEQTRSFLCGKPTKLVLWDLMAGTVTYLSYDELEELARQGKIFSAKIEGGRAAILAPMAGDYGYSMKFQNLSEEEDFPYEIQVFREMGAARDWLISG